MAKDVVEHDVVASAPAASAPATSNSAASDSSARAPRSSSLAGGPAARDGARGERLPPFDFTRAMRRVTRDMVTRLPELRHIDLQRVAFSCAQARKAVPHGLYADLTPLRFEGGERTSRSNGRTYGVERVLAAEGVEALYVLTFFLPRFMEVDFQEKLVTIFHELWHISPAFDGDLRRHEGRCYLHTSSEQQYDAEMARLANRWLSLTPPPDCYAFLQLDFTQLEQLYGGVSGRRIPRPKLLPL